MKKERLQKPCRDCENNVIDPWKFPCNDCVHLRMNHYRPQKTETWYIYKGYHDDTHPEPTSEGHVHITYLKIEVYKT